MTAATNPDLPKGRFESGSSDPSDEDVELGLRVKTAPIGDEEAQSHMMPTLLSRDMIQ